MPKKFLKNYFSYTKQQRNGLVVLASISVLLLLIRLSFFYFIKPGEIEIKNLPVLPIEKTEKSSAISDSVEHKAKTNRIETSALKWSPFNPNTVTLEELMGFGLSKKTANTFIKFRSKGFKFKHKEDVKRVYGINDSLYQLLYSYIELTDGANEKQQWSATKSKNQPVPIEINAADTLQLLSISILDKSAVKRILKKRESLGGFVSLNQLNEVYGFDAHFCNQLKPFLSVNLGLVKRLNPNTSTFYSLNKHPYISEELAQQIIQIRKKAPLNELTFSRLLNDNELLEKLLPYLSFE